MSSASFRTARERVAASIRSRNKPVPEAKPVGETRNSWTPTDVSGAGLSLTVNDARFVRVGNLMFASFSVTYPATGSGATAKIGGLPGSPRVSTSRIYGGEFAQTTAQLTRMFIDGDGNIQLTDSTGLAEATNAGVSTKTMGGTIVYEVNA
jgi:hypothetical protein